MFAKTFFLTPISVGTPSTPSPTMPRYAKRRNNVKRSSARRTIRRLTRSRPSTRRNRQAAKSNARAIIAVKRQLDLNKERVRWRSGFSEIAMTNTQGINIIPLTSGPSTTSAAVMNTVIGEVVPWDITMTPVPQSGNVLRSKYVINNQYVDLLVTAGNETALLNMTAFLVQLRPDNATQTYAETSSMTTLIRDTDFSTPSNAVGGDSGYGAYMNTSRYKIIKRLEFETSGHPPVGYVGQPGASTGNTGSGTNMTYCKRVQFKVPYGNTVLKSTGLQATGAGLAYAEIDPAQKRFIVFFSTNSLLDGETTNVAMSCLTTGYACE